MALCFSHKLTDEQVRDAKESLFVDEFVPMPYELSEQWQQLSPSVDIARGVLAKVVSFLERHTYYGDYVLAQGDYGMTFAVVDWCGRNGRVPVYSTTQRIYENRPLETGELVNTHMFRHVRFRRYFNCEGKPV